MTTYKTETREAHGKEWTVEWVYDQGHGAPWDECDGHGPVSDWERRDKLPGELILNEDHGSKRFYDFAEAVKIARRDGWGTGEAYDTKGAQAAAAAMADFEYLRGWCNDEWHYCGIVVTLNNGGDDIRESIWGIESSEDEYHEEVIAMLMRECLHQVARNTYPVNEYGV